MKSSKFGLIFQVGAISGEGLKKIDYYNCNEYEESNGIVTFLDSESIRRCFSKRDIFSIIPVQVKTEYSLSAEPKVTYRKFDYYQCQEDYSSNIAAEPEENYYNIKI